MSAKGSLVIALFIQPFIALMYEFDPGFIQNNFTWIAGLRFAVTSFAYALSCSAALTFVAYNLFDEYLTLLLLAISASLAFEMYVFEVLIVPKYDTSNMGSGAFWLGTSLILDFLVRLPLVSYPRVFWGLTKQWQTFLFWEGLCLIITYMIPLFTLQFNYKPHWGVFGTRVFRLVRVLGLGTILLIVQS